MTTALLSQSDGAHMMAPHSHVRRRLVFAAMIGTMFPFSIGTVSGAVETYEAGLSALVAPHAKQLQAAGIQSILTRTGKRRRDIQVLTQWGPTYFPWPKGVTPAVFEIYVAKDGTAEVYTDGHSESTKARYAAAFNAVVPEAIRQAGLTRAAATKPKH